MYNCTKCLTEIHQYNSNLHAFVIIYFLYSTLPSNLFGISLENLNVFLIKIKYFVLNIFLSKHSYCFDDFNFNFHNLHII